MASFFQTHKRITLSQAVQYTFVVYAFFIPWSRSGISIFSAFFALLWFLEGNYREKFNFLRKDPISVAIFSFVIYLVVTLLWTENYERAYANLKDFSYLLIAPPAIFSLQKKALRLLMPAFAAGVILDIIISYILFFELIHVDGVIPENPRVFMTHLEYSLLMALFSLYSLNNALFLPLRGKKGRLYFVLAALSAILLFLTHGRSGQLAFLVILPFVLLFRFQGRLRLYALLGGIAAGVFIVFMALQFTTSFEARAAHALKSLKMAQEGDYRTSWGKRVLANRYAAQIFTESPIFGHGVGDSTRELEKKIDLYETPEMKAYMDEFVDFHLHNQYMEYAVQGGLIALALFFNLFFQLLRQAGPPGRWSSNLAWLFSGLFWVGFIAEPYLAKQFSAAFFSLMLVFVVSLHRLEGRQGWLEPRELI